MKKPAHAIVLGICFVLTLQCLRNNKVEVLESFNCTFSKFSSESIDSLWMYVVTLDGDTSFTAREIRDSISYCLFNFATENAVVTISDTSVYGKALLFSYFVLFRNRNNQLINERFESIVEIEDNLWYMIFPIYLKSVFNANHSMEQSIEKLLLNLESDTNQFHKQVYHNELGKRLNYIKKYVDAKEHFEMSASIFSNMKKSTMLSKEQHEVSQSYLRQLSLSIGSDALDFCALGLDGEEICLRNYRDKFVLLSFWATWCKPCVEQLPELKELYQDYGKDQLEIIGITLDKNEGRFKEWILENQIDWPQIFEGGSSKRKGEITRLYNGVSLPTYYIIDHEGKVRYNHASDSEGQSVIEQLRRLLNS